MGQVCYISERKAPLSISLSRTWSVCFAGFCCHFFVLRLIQGDGLKHHLDNLVGVNKTQCFYHAFCMKRKLVVGLIGL